MKPAKDMAMRLRSVNDDPQRKDRNKTGSKEASDINSTGCRKFGLVKNNFITKNCADKFAFSACQNVSGSLSEWTASHGSSR